MFLVRENGRGGDGGGIFTILRRAFAEGGGLRRDRKVEIHRFSQQNIALFTFAEPWANPSPFPPERPSFDSRPKKVQSRLFSPPFPIGGPTIKVAAKWTRGEEEGRIANAAATITLQFFFCGPPPISTRVQIQTLYILRCRELYEGNEADPCPQKNTLVVSSGLRHF